MKVGTLEPIMVSHMNKNTDDDSQLFREAMRGITPLSAPKKKLVSTSKPAGNTAYRKHKAQMPDKQPLPAVSISHAINADDILAYAQPGLAVTQYQRLKTGKIAIEAALDLHGYTVDQALVLLNQFLIQARARGQRCLRIVHGKGRHDKLSKPLLKNMVLGFLQAQSDILAFHSAPANQGGTGAVLVLLKR